MTNDILKKNTIFNSDLYQNIFLKTFIYSKSYFKILRERYLDTKTLFLKYELYKKLTYDFTR